MLAMVAHDELDRAGQNSNIVGESDTDVSEFTANPQSWPGPPAVISATPVA
nr:hypothetical protein [Rhodococcus sp. 06-235-1A]